MTTIAITRSVPPSLVDCELTHQVRQPIDVARARREHEQYEAALRAVGCQVVRLPDTPDLPDSVFVEDTAVVFDECAVITRPGAESRRPEIATVREVLSDYRDVYDIDAPGTLDGGDVLRVGRRVYVGITTRTNPAGPTQLAAILKPFGYEVRPVEVGGYLHLKSTVTAVGEDLVLVNHRAPVLDDVASIRVHDDEPFAANVLWLNGTVLCPANAPRTTAMLQDLGFEVVTVENTELAKAEAGLTCCSLLLKVT